MDAGLVKLVVVTFRVGAEGDGVGFQLELDEDDASFFVAVEGFLGELLSDEQLDGYDRLSLRIEECDVGALIAKGVIR